MPRRNRNSANRSRGSRSRRSRVNFQKVFDVINFNFDAGSNNYYTVADLPDSNRRPFRIDKAVVQISSTEPTCFQVDLVSAGSTDGVSSSSGPCAVSQYLSNIGVRRAPGEDFWPAGVDTTTNLIRLFHIQVDSTDASITRGVLRVYYTVRMESQVPTSIRALRGSLPVSHSISHPVPLGKPLASPQEDSDSSSD